MYCCSQTMFAFREKLTVVAAPAKRVMSLKDPTAKMSKSHPDPRSRILLTDSAEEIRSKIMVALTDSQTGITYDPASRPGVSNLIELLSYMHPGSQTCDEIASELSLASMRAMKEKVAEAVSAHLRDIRERYLDIVDNNKYLKEVASEGAEMARINADRTMVNVKGAIGLN